MSRERVWPHKNSGADIAERQERIRPLVGEDGALLFSPSVPMAVLAHFQECVTSHVVLPVGVVGPLRLDLGDYDLGEDGEVVERGRSQDQAYVPLAHSEGGLSASLLRGARACSQDGPLHTFVLADRITRDSCFVFDDSVHALAFAKFASDHQPAASAWLLGAAAWQSQPLPAQAPVVARRARLWELSPHVVGGDCHLRYHFTTGDACGPNMMTKNAYALNQHFFLPLWLDAGGVPPRQVLLEANMGGDKKPSASFFEQGHGKTVLAEAHLRERTLRRHLQTTSADLLQLEQVGLHGAHASGMQSFAFTPGSAIAAIFAATGQDLGMVGTSSMAHGMIRAVADGVVVSMRLPGLEVGTVGGGTGLPHARAHLALMGCLGEGKVYRFAQIVVAAVLALEVSAAASMASEGSRNFAWAHAVYGGARLTGRPAQGSE
ncbi:MAG: 3-hydroxy-3-methylglutaryl-CoA reductase [Sulfobacillus sp.]